MPLKDACAKYVGRLLFVLPVEGFGWCRMDARLPSDQPGSWMEPPEPFHVRLMEFHHFHGKIMGGVGSVEQRGHVSDGKWVAFCVRDRGKDIYDFVARPGKYNVRIGDERPTVVIDPEHLPMPEWMRFQGVEVLSGLGYIAEEEISLEEVLKRLKK